MKNRQKIYEALLDLLHDRKPVTKNALCCRSGVQRMQLDRIIKKHKDFIDVEVIKNV